MSEDFKVGDVVVCVDDSPAGSPINRWRRLSAGSVYRVTAAFRAPSGGPVVLLNGEPRLLGRASGKPTTGWCAQRFEHLPKADEQFTAQIRACKPIRKGVPA